MSFRVVARQKAIQFKRIDSNIPVENEREKRGGLYAITDCTHFTINSINA